MTTLYLWQINDITSIGPDVFSNTSDANNGSVGVSTFSISDGATMHAIDVIDDDDTLENNDSSSQDIASPAIFNGASFATGDNIQAEYSYIIRPIDSNDPADNITVHAFRIDNTVHGVASDVPLVPGLDYNVISNDSNSPSVAYSSMVCCFAAGTLILTDRGERPIETLTVGSMVKTLHHNLQPVRWIGKRRVSPAELRRHPNLRPIQIRKGALDKNCIPTADLTVSPQHRMLIASAIVERIFGSKEALIAAKKLLPIAGIDIIQTNTSIEYWHIMCDEHQVVIANGTPAETFFPGSEALKTLSEAAYGEITHLFPEFGHGWTPRPAALFATGYRGKKLVERQVKNRKPIVSNGFRIAV